MNKVKSTNIPSSAPSSRGGKGPASSSGSDSAAKRKASSPSGKRKSPSRTSASGKRGKKRSSAKGRVKARKPLFQFEVKWWMGLVAVGVIAVAILIPFLASSSPGSGAPLPKGSYSYGIDISHHNKGGIVWDSLTVMTDRHGYTTRSKKDALFLTPISFVFMKATEGEKMVDGAFESNWQEAGKRKYLSRGAYHFYRTNKDPRKQALNFCRTVGSLRYRDLPPVLDIETLHTGCSRKQLNEGISLWLRTVEEHFGRTPIIYTGESFASTHLEDSLLRRYPLWVAHYGVPSPKRDDWRWWQFTDKGVVYGVPGFVDMNVRKSR